MSTRARGTTSFIGSHSLQAKKEPFRATSRLPRSVPLLSPSPFYPQRTGAHIRTPGLEQV
jgi:hypothetical protein